MKRLNPQFLHYAVIAVLVVIILALAMCGKSRKDYVPVTDLKAQLDSSAKRVKYLENKNGQLVADNTAIKAQSARDVEALSNELFKLRDKDNRTIKDVRYVTRIEQVVKHDTLLIPYTGSLITTDTIHVPKAFAYKDSNQALYGRVTKQGVKIDSSYHNLTTYLRHGTRKVGWFGREDFVQAVSPNPNVNITGLSTITYKVRPNAWNRWIKPVACLLVGAAGSYYITK